MKLKTQEEFIKKAKKLFNDKYDYSKVNFKEQYTQVLISCPRHGDYTQLPLQHLEGAGCVRCATSHYSK